MMESSYMGGMPELRICGIIRNWLQLFKKKVEKEKIISFITCLGTCRPLKKINTTCYDGFEERDSRWAIRKKWVVKDGSLDQSWSASTALALAYALVEQFGGRYQSLRQECSIKMFWRCLKKLFWTYFLVKDHSMTRNKLLYDLKWNDRKMAKIPLMRGFSDPLSIVV